MAGKIEKLEKIMRKIIENEGMQEGASIILNKNPARIYFLSYAANIDQIAEKYGLRKDNSQPKNKSGMNYLGFKLNSKIKGGLD